jgi:hypothetical protein
MFSKPFQVFVWEHPAKSLRAGPWGLLWQWTVIVGIALVCAFLIGVKLKMLNVKEEAKSSVPTNVHARP